MPPYFDSFDGFHRSTGPGIKLLGGTLSKDLDYNHSFIEQRVDKCVESMQLVLNLKDPQLCLLLLRACEMMPKLVFTWRTMHPIFLEDAINTLDSSIMDTLRLISVGDGPSFGDFQLSLASLPISKGGLGILLASDVANYTFASSVMDTLSLQNSILGRATSFLPQKYKFAVDTFTTKLFPDNPVQAADISTKIMMPLKNTQKFMAQLFFDSKKQKLLSHVYITTKSIEVQRCFRAVLSSIIQPVASAWLFAMPNYGMMQKMSPSEFHSAISYRLLIPQFTADQNCLCTGCHKKLDIYGYHPLNHGNLFARHQTVRDALYDLASKAGFHPRKDAEVFCLGMNGARQRPADILMSGDDYAEDCIDVTVVSPLPATITAEIKIGQKVEAAELAKYRKHELACENASYGFRAFAVDVFGVFAKRSLNLLHRIRNSLMRKTGYPEWLATAVCYRRISIAVQIAVARRVVAIHYQV
jgi:hypothetical protein